MAEAVFSAILAVLFDRLASEDVLEYFRRYDMGKEVKMLDEKLRDINDFLDDAENKQYESKSVKQWLDELRDAGYDAEDVIDEFDLEVLRKKLESDSQTGSSKLSRLLKANFSPKAISKKIKKKKNAKKIIKEITERFEKLAQKRYALGLKELLDHMNGPIPSTFTRETSSVVDVSRVHGRDHDKEKIKSLLLKEDLASCGSKFTVIPIVGMGGIGKTTLAQIVYNDNKVKDHFDLKGWVCVSDHQDHFDVVKRMTKAILESLTSEPSKFNDLDQLQLGVKEALTGKKFLIVLDDVWSTKYGDWDLLRQPFGVGAAGSAIIVTTRHKEVAAMMGAIKIDSLQKLSEADCWNVFAQHAFESTSSVDEKPTLARIGQEIARKCDGLPLAAISLGGLLRSKEEYYEWKNVLDSKIWDIPEDANGILPALKLSYHHLPTHLKPCFSYLAIFPKDYEFGEEEIVLLWMAQGFLQQPPGNMDMEVFGHKCFRDLLSRSFFQPSSNNNSMFVMHDLMSDLAQWVAGKTCFRLEDLSNSGKERETVKKARHSSYIGGEYDGVKKFDAFNGVDCLRTFLPLQRYSGNLSNNVTFDLLPKLKFLRVLSLRNYNITVLPSSIGDLKHLRFLDLYETKIKSLPESISTLYKLQTLLLKGCYKLKNLPEEIGSLINLRHLDISNVDFREGMPPRVGRLTSLRKLSDYFVGKDSGSGIGELENLKDLRGTLRISELQNVTDVHQAKKANIEDKEGLNVLIMRWMRSSYKGERDESVEKEVLHWLRPHKNLEELTIDGYSGTSFPIWIGNPSFSNMVHLKLEGCDRCTALPPLGQLPLLKDLRIIKMNEVESVGSEFYGKDCSVPFPSLETLYFEQMFHWKGWSPCEFEVFLPRLRELSISSCSNLLGSLPKHLPSLEILKVHGCEKLIVDISSFPRLCKLEIHKCQELVQRRQVVHTSLKSMDLEHISNARCLSEWWLIQDLKGVEYLKLSNCGELPSLHNLISLRELTIKGSLQTVPLVLPPMLRRLSVRNCGGLKSVAEASSWYDGNTSSKLESLYIRGCDSLTSIARASLFSTIKELHVEECPRLQSLLVEDEEEEDASSSSSSSTSRSRCLGKQDINNNSASLLEDLKTLDCPSLTSLSFLSTGELPATLKWLQVENCPKLEWEKLQGNTSLERIRIKYCHSLEILPDLPHNLRELDISICKLLVSFPTVGLHTTLKHLQVWSCPKLESLGGLPNNLKRLSVSSCPKLESLGGLPTTLKRLSVSSCPKLESLGGFPATLKRLYVSSCPKMESLGERLQNNMPLEYISISDCDSLASLPEDLHNLTCLSIIELKRCPRLVSFPDGGLPSANLRELAIHRCEKLEALPNRIHDLTSLRQLTIDSCPALVIFQEEGGLHRLASLRELTIKGGCPDMVSFPPGEEERMMLPSSLIKLTIGDFPSLECLSSKGFRNLTSIEELTIENCPKLKSFPEKALLQSLMKLVIDDCPLLKERCENDRGQEWLKIAHIPLVYLDPGAGVIEYYFDSD